MKPLPHHYRIRLSGGPAGYAAVGADGLPDLRTAPPADFGGPGDAWGPEQLLLAALGACFLFTLRVVAGASRVPFTALELAVDGTVDRQDGTLRFTEVVFRPRLTVPAGVEPARALRMLEKAERACLVTASLATPVRLEPEVHSA